MVIDDAIKKYPYMSIMINNTPDRIKGVFRRNSEKIQVKQREK